MFANIFSGGGNIFGVRGFRCLHKKCFLKKALALALGALGVFAVGLPVQAIENYQLNGITVYANKGNGTLVEPLGGVSRSAPEYTASGDQRCSRSSV